MSSIENDHIIRVILEGRDLLSNALTRAANTYEKEFARIRKTNENVSRSFDNVEDHITVALKRINDSLNQLGGAAQRRNLREAQRLLDNIGSEIDDLKNLPRIFKESDDEVRKFTRDVSKAKDELVALDRGAEAIQRRNERGQITRGPQLRDAQGRFTNRFGPTRFFAAPAAGAQPDESFVRAIGAEELFRRLGKTQLDLSRLADTPLIPPLDKSILIDYTRFEEKIASIEVKVNRGRRAFERFGHSIVSFFRGLDRGDVRFFEEELLRLRQAEERVARIQARIERARSLGASDRQLEALDFDLNEASRDVDRYRDSVSRLDTTLFRVGRSIRRFIDSSRQLVQVRWLVLAAGINVYVTAIIALGAALTEIASSAVAAGAALGGALVTGLLAAAGATAILRAGLGRVAEVFGLVEDAEEQQVKSGRESASQADAQRQAQERLTDAIQDQQDAIQDLAKARRDAARDIVRANEDERLANLSLQEAEMAVIEAKRELLKLEQESAGETGVEEDLRGRIREAEERLRLARQLGQEAEISAASQQLAVAKQNLQNFLNQADNAKERVQEAQNAVQRAEINLQQQQIRTRRERREAAETRRAGVEGNDGVIAAQRRLRDATEAVEDAKLAVVDASKKESAAAQDLEAKIEDLSGAERRLFNTLKTARERFRQVFRPVTDIIVSAVDRAVQRSARLLEDGRIVGAARGVSTAIGSAIDRLSSFSVSREGRNAITFFLREARAAIPFVARGLENMVKVFVRIGQAAAPIFRSLIVGITGFTSNIEKATRNQRRLERFFATAATHLRSWVELGKAIARVLIEIGRGAAPSGQTLIDDLTAKLNEFAEFLKENRKEVRAFFEEARQDISRLAAALVPLAVGIFKAFSTDEAQAFTRLIIEVLVPAFQDAIFFLGLMSQAILQISRIPIAKEFIGFLFALGILRRIFPFLRNLDSLLVGLTGRLIKSEGFKEFFRQGTTRAIEFANVIDRKILQSLERMRKAILASEKAQRLLNLAVRASPYIIAVTLIIAALILLERQFGVLSRAWRDVSETFQDGFDKIKRLARLLTVDMFNFGRDLVQGVIDGARSKAQDLADTIISIVKSPWEAAKSFFGISSPSLWTKVNIGIPLGEGIAEGVKEGMSGLSGQLISDLNRQLTQAESTMKSVARRITNSLGNLEFMVSQQIGTRLEGQTPSEKALQNLEEQETRRQRQQGINDANETVKQAQKEFNKATNERERAERRLTNAVTNEQKQRARQELTNARQSQQLAKQNLDDAVKNRQEVLRQAALDEERERLAALAEQERKALERSVQAEQNRATKMFEAFKNALKKQDFKEAQKIFERILTISGIEDLGRANARDYVFGFLDELRRTQGLVSKGVAAQTQQAQAAAAKETQAGRILQRGGFDTSRVAGQGGREQSDLGILRGLIASRALDLEIALEIVRKLSKRDASRVLAETLSNEGLRISDLPSLFEGASGPKQRLARYLRRFGSNAGRKGQTALAAFAEALEELQIFASGGAVQGSQGAAVPAIVHVGEWVLNREQQARLAQRYGESTTNIKNFLFGKNPPDAFERAVNARQRFKHPARDVFYNLVKQTDEYGADVFFVEFDDGAYGQISPGSAAKIQRTHGRWFPQSLIQSPHGFTKPILKFKNMLRKAGLPASAGNYALGGIVTAATRAAFPSYGVKSYAAGGIVTGTPSGDAGFGNSKTFHQNFNVTTQNETDWNYVMRLAAIHATS